MKIYQHRKTQQTRTRHLRHHNIAAAIFLLIKQITPLIIAAILLSACGDRTDHSGSGSELRFISGAAIDTLDPQGTSWLNDFRIIECLYEPLLKVRPDNMQLESAVAENWQVSDSGYVYTFKLRPNAKWSNGDKVKATDFIFAWRRAMMPDFAADYSGLMFTIKGAKEFLLWRTEKLKQFNNHQHTTEPTDNNNAQLLWQKTLQYFDKTVGLKAIDELTLQVTLKQPTSYFPQLCAFATFMPLHEKSAMTAMTINPDTGLVTMNSSYFNNPQTIVCNGPYQLDQWMFKQELILQRNPHYWNSKQVTCDRIIQQVNDDVANALLKYEAGEVHWLPDIPTTTQIAADLVRQKRPDVHTTPAAGTYYYLFNCRPQIAERKNPLADNQVRLALSLCIDRRLIVKRITRMNQPVALTFIPPGCIKDYQSPINSGCSYDPDKAKELLKNAGYENGQELGPLSILYNNEGGHEGPAQAIKKMWEEQLGVHVTLEGVEKNRFRQRRRSGDFTIARGGWFGDYRDPTTFLDMLRTGDGNNDGGYNNIGFNQLLDLAAVETNPEKRMQILQAAEALMLKDQPVAPIYQYINLDLFNPQQIKNLHLNPWNYRRLEWVQITD